VGFVVGTAVLKSFKFVIKILQVKKKKIRLFSINFTNLIKKKKKKKPRVRNYEMCTMP
jgi:hypothetical protein